MNNNKVSANQGPAATPPSSVRAIVSWLEATASGTATNAGSTNSASSIDRRHKCVNTGSPVVSSSSVKSSAAPSPTILPRPLTTHRSGCRLPRQRKSIDDGEDPFISQRPVYRQRSSSSTTTVTSTAITTATTVTTASSIPTTFNAVPKDLSLQQEQHQDAAASETTSTNWLQYNQPYQRQHKACSLQRLDEVMRKLAWFLEPDDHLDNNFEKKGEGAEKVGVVQQRQEVDTFWHSVRQYLDIPDEELCSGANE